MVSGFNIVFVYIYILSFLKVNGLFSCHTALKVNGLFSGHTALQAASQYGHLDIVKLLISRNANLEVEVSIFRKYLLI